MEGTEYAILILAKDLSIHQFPSLASVRAESFDFVSQIFYISYGAYVTIEVTLADTCLGQKNLVGIHCIG